MNKLNKPNERKNINLTDFTFKSSTVTLFQSFLSSVYNITSHLDFIFNTYVRIVIFLPFFQPE